jgi:Ribonuclease G/E
MTLTLLIACGAAETIGALVAGDEIVRFFFAPARGDEALRREAEAGDIVLGRIKTAAPGLGGAFVDIGAGEDAFLPFRPDAKAAAEGAALVLRVRRPALGGKGAILDWRWEQGLPAPRARLFSAAAGLPRLLSESFDPAFAVARRAAEFPIGEIVTERPEAQRALAAEGIASICDERRVQAFDVEDALGGSLEPAVSLSGGARMIFAETAGGAVVDIDSGSAANAARKPNDSVNELAARRLFRELSRRAIGGRIVVDFLPPSSPSKRRTLFDLAGATDLELFERRTGKLAPDGLFDFTAPRRDLSLLERASEPAIEGLIRPGRRLTVDWASKRAIAALETRLKRHPRLRARLDASAEIVRYLEGRPQWLARLIERHGPRVAVSASRPAGDFHVSEY